MTAERLRRWRSVDSGDPFERGETAFVVGHLRGDVTLAQREGLPHVLAEGEPGTRSGRLKGGPLVCADSDGDRRHLPAEVRDGVAFVASVAGHELAVRPLQRVAVTAGVGLVGREPVADAAREVGVFAHLVEQFGPLPAGEGDVLAEHAKGVLGVEGGAGRGEGGHTTNVARLSYGVKEGS